MELKFRVQAKIKKPVSEVFDAIYNPKKLSTYFTTGGASGPLEEGRTVEWSFADTGEHVRFPVKVTRVVRNKLIQFQWEASEGHYDPKSGKMPEGAGYDTTVELSFEPLSKDETLVTITEGTWRPTEKGLQGSYGNCAGWMNMYCCLKAYLEHGINLRKDSF
jgi:uncharacterized protein YndB with AHSA1/START domain